MEQNLLFDTQFRLQNDNWKCVNCKRENNVLISESKVFGIEQELTISQLTRLYFRYNYKVKSGKVKLAYAGIQIGDKLLVNRKIPKLDIKQAISLVEDINETTIKVKIIFESNEDKNVVELFEPVLCDLRKLHRSTYIKVILDMLIKYVDGYAYQNNLEYCEVKPEIFNLEKAKVGSIISTNEPMDFEIMAKLSNNTRYLLKLNYEEVSQLGEISFQYGFLKSTKIDNQIYITFRANETDKLILHIKPNDVLPYQVNLKHMLLIKMSDTSIRKEDIQYLPYVEGAQNG